MRVLVMGATGYVGGRPAPMLAEAGHDVRCLTRTPDKLRDVPWGASVEIVAGDALEPASLDAAMSGIDVVYYLVHSIGSGADFEDSDRRAAHHTAQAATASGVRRIVHLDAQGYMYALNGATGAVLWESPSGGSCLSGAAISNGTVYWGSGYSN